jgi:hypothetical protein
MGAHGYALNALPELRIIRPNAELGKPGELFSIGSHGSTGLSRSDLPAMPETHREPKVSNGAGHR